MLYFLDLTWLSHVLNYFWSYTTSISYWLHIIAEMSIVTGDCFDRMTDPAEIFGASMLMFEITILTFTVMVIIQQVSARNTQDSTNVLDKVNADNSRSQSSTVNDSFSTAFSAARKNFFNKN